MEEGNKGVFTLLLAGEALAQSRHSVSAAERHSDGPHVSPRWPTLLFLPGTSFKVQSTLSTLSQTACIKWEVPSSFCVPLNREDMQGGCQPVPL